jgi:hypothetical protein
VVECHILKEIAYSISKIPIPQNERKQTGPKRFLFSQRKLIYFSLGKLKPLMKMVFPN